MRFFHDHGFFSNLHFLTAKRQVEKKPLVNVAVRRVLGSLLGFVLLGHLAGAPENAGAQITPAYARSAAAVDFDQTIGMPPYVFRAYQFAAAEPGKVRVEVYIGMVNDILQFVKNPADSNYRAQYEVSITLWDKEKNPLDSRNWKRELVVADFDATNDRKKFNLEHAGFDLPPGDYEIALEITDRDTGKNLRDRRPLKLTPLAGEQIHLSSVIFTKAVPASMVNERDSLLQHYAALTTNLAVTASTARTEKQAPESREAMIGAAAYFEIYGAHAGETLQLQYELLDWRRQPQQTWNETLTVAQTPVRHLVDFAGKINQAGLHTFRLLVQRGAEAKAKAAQAEESFQVQINADPNFATALAANQALLYEPLRYIVKGADYKRIAETAAATRDSLVAAFWQQRDPDPGAAGNQLRDEFYRRVAFADLRFASALTGKAGWESDRGRIYIKYGPPREVHHQLAEQGAAPYEIWLYPDLDMHFVFRDKTGSGDFELINR